VVLTKSKLNFLVCLGIALLILPIHVQGMKIDITTNNPSGIIENVNCGGNAPIEFTATNIDGYYGVTCWYSTDKSDWLNGTTCIGRTQSKTFTAHVEMPKTGTDTQSVYIVCRDYGYWDLGGYHDSCHSSYDWAYSSYVNGYPDKVTNCYINGAKDADCIATKTLTLSCSSLDFSINSNKNDVSLFCGESATATITVSNNFEDDIQCARRPATRNDMPALNIYALLLRYARGDRLPYIFKTRVGHIAVRAPLVFLDQRLQRIGKLDRRAEIGISQAEVEDVFLAELRLEPDPFLKHLPYPRRLAHRIAYLRRNGHSAPLDGEYGRTSRPVFRDFIKHFSS